MLYSLLCSIVAIIVPGYYLHKLFHNTLADTLMCHNYLRKNETMAIQLESPQEGYLKFETHDYFISIKLIQV